MAIIIWNPHTSGSFGKIVFCKRGKTCFFRKWIKPPDPKSFLQQSNRNSFAAAVRSWQAMQTEEKEVYAKRAVHLNMSGYNLYVKEYMKGGFSGERQGTDNRMGAGTVPLQHGHSAETAPSLDGCSRSGFASPPLLLRSSSCTPALTPLTSGLSEAESALYSIKRGVAPP